MNSLTQDRPTNHRQSNSHELYVSECKSNSNWDRYLASLDAGHHVQTSLWSKVKALNGWSTKRIVVSNGTEIVGGAQILIRKVRGLGSVGYVPKGPVLGCEDHDLAETLLDRILTVAQSERLRVLFVQPPEETSMVERLTQHGFRSCPVETAPSATILVDLTADLDAILARMPKGMRNQVRRSQKRGIKVREGTREDLPVFHQLLSATSQRRGFSTFDLNYFQGMWEILEPSGNIKLFLSELDGEAVSAQFCIPFGDTVVAKQIGWSGQHGRLHPNEALDWFTIQWAKTNGYKYYDLEGIERPAATAVVNGQALPEQFVGTPTAYKLRLGGDVKLSPGAYCYITNRCARWVYNRIGNRLSTWPIIQKAADRFRTG